MSINNLGELASRLGDDLLRDGLNNSVFGGLSSAVGLSAKLSFGASSTEEKRASSQSTATGGAVSSGGHTTLQACGNGTKTEDFLNKVISKKVMSLIAQAFGGETGEYAYDATAPKPTPAPKPATGSEASTGAQTMSQNRQ